MIGIKIFVILFFGCLFFIKAPAAEVDNGFMLINREPWKISWVQESEKVWSLTAIFDNGITKTYFEGPPPTKGFGLTPSKKPIKQEFKYFPANKTFTSKNFQFEQWPDGAKALSFEFDQSFKMMGKKYRLGVVSIIQEVGGAQDEVRYSIMKSFE
ncbi:MAG: hypothetical protein P0S96_07305 [Simkaniaceae bacterium]|nr:hypothetical protein [Candidatus Sacchlamyda saccharinae]